MSTCYLFFCLVFSISLFRSLIAPRDLNSFVSEQQAILNGIHVNLSKSPVNELEVSYRKIFNKKHVSNNMYLPKEQNRQYALLIENQKQQRARLEDQRQFGVGSSIVIIS